MIKYLALSLTFTLGLQGAAHAMDVDGAKAAATRLLARNNPLAQPADLAQQSKATSNGSSAQISEITYDDELVTEVFKIFASENLKLFELVSNAGRGLLEKEAACEQVNKQLENNKGLYTTLTVRPTQITPAGVGLFENSADLDYIKQALSCP